MFFFTADEHYGHRRIVEYAQRPFESVEAMDAKLMANFNALVSKRDVTVHVGDFSFHKRTITLALIERLNGTHVFLRGSHDSWLRDRRYLWVKRIEGQRVVACHYAMRSWPGCHQGAWHVYGHHHGFLEPLGKSWDVGVDCNDFRPVSFEQLTEYMATLDEWPDDGRGK